MKMFLKKSQKFINSKLIRRNTGICQRGLMPLQNRKLQLGQTFDGGMKTLDFQTVRLL